ncbi:amino acid adenylation domain-containing protein, partial [Tenacibaculum sp. FZY0031]|uniref:non-ribosomal peptide synthetase n=1 Tax=Tenacibaculum sp. FZY0031 TaxID=3116648 RepID=UPI002EC9AC10|nr:amino acid adenylation domain-containing protein [Tenacibaculum sp. FZY0031]
ESFVRPFDLNKEYPFRVGIVRDIEGGHLLLIDMHHIISDGVSHSILLEEFARLYEGEALPEVSLHYKDYAEWQQGSLNSVQRLSDEEYWQNMYASPTSALVLPYDYTRPAIKSDVGLSIDTTIDSDRVEKIRAFIEVTGTTMFMFLLSIHKIVLSRLSGQEDIVIGTPTSGRSHADIEQTVGMFVNTLALRSYPLKDKKFTAYLQEVKELVLSSFEHEGYQYEDLIDRLSIERDTSRNPLFDVMFAYQYVEEVAASRETVGIERYSIGENSISKFDLELDVEDNGEELSLSATYCAALFTERTIQNYLKYIITCIDEVLECSDQLISKINLLTKEEQEVLIKDFGKGTSNTVYKEASFLELFESQVQSSPEDVAIVFGEEKLSYQELNIRSTNLAIALQAQGAKPQDFIGVYMDRGISVIVSILGVLKMGGVYVPIEVEYPKERVNFILSDSSIKYLLVTESVSLEKLSLEATKVLLIEDDKEERKVSSIFTKPRISGEDLAYMIYTSGTTGKPKGVMISHNSLSDYVHTVKEYFGLKSTDSILQQSSISFDTSIEEIFPILGVGGKLVITEDRRDFDKLISDCITHKITVLSTNPYLLSYLNEHIDSYDLSLRILISGGDVLKWYHVNHLVSKFDVYNSYGPTETTVCATYYKVKKELDRIPIGFPISNRVVYILDEHLQLQPNGVIGELCIGGIGVSKGYLNREELTKSSFVKDPFRAGETMYRTGDLARWLADGTIEFIGRKDTQVKIRGRRIELGEIINQVESYSKVAQSVVQVQGSENDKYL